MRAADSQTLAASASASFQLQSTPACCAVSNASHRSNSWSSPSSSAARPLTSATVIRTGENRVISWNMELQQLVQRFSGCGVKALSLQGDGNFTISPAADSARVKIGGSAPSIGTKCFTGVPCGATPHRCGSPRVIGSSRACANASIRYAPEAACPTRAPEFVLDSRRLERSVEALIEQSRGAQLGALSVASRGTRLLNSSSSNRRRRRSTAAADTGKHSGPVPRGTSRRNVASDSVESTCSR
jgi:hypothetical protein